MGIEAFQIEGPFAATGAGDTASRRQIFICRPDTAAGRGAVRADDSVETGAARLSPAGDRRRRPHADRVLPRRARQRGFEAGIELALERLLISPEFLFRIEQDPPGATPGAPYRITQIGAGLASVVLPLEQHSGRRTARPGGGGQAERARSCSSSRFAACCATRAPTRWSTNFAGQWLYLRNIAALSPDPDAVPRVRRQPARRLPARDRAVPREPAARRPAA